MLSDHIELKCGCVYPLVADDCRNKQATMNMPVTDGYVNNNKVTVLRDTGCSTIVVRRDLVPSELLTGQEETCILIDGTIRQFPVAVIEVDTSFIKGQVHAVCMRNPLYDLIIGNVPGVTQSSDAVLSSCNDKTTGEITVDRYETFKCFASVRSLCLKRRVNFDATDRRIIEKCTEAS